jgi:hypothetical protein
MSSRKLQVFEDTGRHLDRFGLVLGLSALSASTLALIDLESATDSLRSELGWLLVMFSVGATLIVAFGAAGVRKRWRTVANIVIGVVLVGAVAVTLLDEHTQLGIVADLARPSVLWVLIAIASPVVVLRRILQHTSVSTQTLFGAVSAYVLIAIAFSYMFLYLDQITAEAFFGVAESTSSYMYFSLVTIATLGYGDLAPVTDVGRYLATVEAIVGQVLLVTVVARIVSVMSRPARSPNSQDNSDA